MNRELLYLWTICTLEVLVPKQRGSGFVKVPYGHHADAGMARIERIAGCDIFGLDGSLSFQTGAGVATYPETQATFNQRVLPVLEQHYGVPARVATHAEFWASHPNGETAPSTRTDVQRA